MGGVRAIWAAAAVAAVGLWLAPAALAENTAETHDVLVVGNNWDGTADVVDPRTFQRLVRLNIVPDRDERMAEIMSDPAAAGFFTGINLLIGEGHNQYVDDAFTSHDGRYLFVSRPSFKDVVGIDLATRKIAWRTQVEGYRADHMGISPDGRRLLVSASTANVVHEIDTATGKILRSFPSGDSPHENNYSADGSRIYHASIGRVYTPTDDPSMEASKGAQYFQLVDARTFKILKRIDMGEKLAEAGYPDMSSAVRPMALAPDERRVYLQISFFHGFVEYDLERDRVLRVAVLPISEEAQQLRREQYLLDSAHHGIAINPEGTKLCVAGTMSDYAAVVSRATFGHQIAVHGKKPYWVTNSGDGRYCFVSLSGDDRVSVVSYALERQVASIPVGDHPQRMRMGTVRCAYLGPAVDCTAPRLSRAKVVERRGRRRLDVRLSEPARLRVAVARARKRRGGGRRWVTVRIIRRDGRAGTNRIPLGRLRHAGHYRATLSATDAAGNAARRKIVRFAVSRG